MKVLLHTCCGPCASACVPRLKELGHEVTMFFANSNISDAVEFEKRKRAAQTLAEADGVPLAAENYDHGEWLREVAAGYEDAPEKGARCARCFRYNLAKTAAYAAAHGFDAFTTSLTVSPHKVSEQVFEAAASALCLVPSALCECRKAAGAGNQAPIFLEENFKKQEGFKRSLKRSEELGLYRQSWCGCEFSKEV